MAEELADRHCPNCGSMSDDATSITSDKDRPDPGDVSFCFECGTALRYTADMQLELIPADELAEHRRNPAFAKAEILGRVLSMVLGSHPPETLPEVELEEVEVDHGDHTHTVRMPKGGLALEIDPETEQVKLIGDGPELPEALQAMIIGAIERRRSDRQAEEVKKYVTPEVANHVLSSYGHEDASMPSLAVSALISLIRTCKISDEELLDDLNQASERIHGYVLAIMLLAEPSLEDMADRGTKILRQMAGLDPKDSDDQD